MKVGRNSKVKQFKVEDIEIGSYVYTREKHGYDIAKVIEIEDRVGTKEGPPYRIWGKWSSVNNLPTTLKGFNIARKDAEDGNDTFARIESISGFLDFNEKVDSKAGNCDISERLLKMDSYESSTIMALNTMLGDGYDFEDVLRVLIPNISKLNENSERPF